MSTHFADAQKKLREGSDNPTNWHFLTISFDPEFDTPEVLQSYAKGFEADPGRWSFATSSLSNIVELADQIGLVFYSTEPNNPAALNHNLRTVVVDTEGRIQKIFKDNEWKPEELAAEMIKAAQLKPTSG
jgi:protein SCO1/2